MNKLFSLLAAVGLPALALAQAPAPGAPLTAPAAIQARPETGAPAIGLLKAGTVPQPAGVAPDGWVAVTVPGPFTIYVPNSALTKGLEVKPGTPLSLEPRPGAAAIATAAKGDKLEITGLHGAWTQLKLDQAILGYVQLAPPAVTLVPAAASGSESGVSATPAATNAPGHPADTGGLTGPQGFEGRFESTRRWYSQQHPYDWQLLDGHGRRIAYLDVTRLLLTEQLDQYSGHDVAVYGTVNAVPNTKELVLSVESLQLK